MPQLAKTRLWVSVDKGRPEEVSCDLLVIACDPRSLKHALHYTAQEHDIFESISNFTFHTTLLKVKRNGATPEHGVIFAPTRLNDMAGSVYGYRNETGKTFGMNVASKPGGKPANELAFNWVTVYQLVRSEKNPPSGAQFEHLMRRGLDDGVSWPYGTDFEIFDHVTTRYFDHFSAEGLAGGDNGQGHKPWRYLDIQGQNATVYVHASTCFESVLHCWLYINMLLDADAPVIELPEDKNAAIVILGAGPSGLLFANALRSRGYRNYRILEKSGRIGGKTHTIVKEQPENGKPVVCELGTCYLSPAYDKFVDAMHPYLKNNHREGFGGPQGKFRGIVTQGQFTRFPAPPVVTYSEYIILKAADELNWSPNDFGRIQARIAEDLGRYCTLHKDLMGTQKPMPKTPPGTLFHDCFAQTFLDFLRTHKLQSLVGLLQYGYSVQGYGNLSTIPAYYGLLWVTPDVARKIEYSFRHPDHPGGDIVTAWSEGWGDLWARISADMDIVTNAFTHTIERGIAG